jgi:inositol monophosphatase 3
LSSNIGFKTVALLRNKADVYFHTSRIYKWDICAPNAILNSYGGKLTKRNGHKIDYSDKKDETNFVENGIIAAVKEYDYFLKLFGNKA